MPAFQMNQKIAVAAVFVSAMFMNIMDITIVNVALPTIGRDFHIDPTAVDGVVIAYLVSLAVFIPASGWLGDYFGGKRVLLVAICVFTVGSVLCGLAHDMTQLVVARIFQGAGGGMMAPVGMAMLFRVFPPAERVRAASILTIPTTMAPALGPVLGGLLVTSLSWRWVFFVNLPLGIAAVIFGALFLERMGTGDAGRFDLPGFVLGGAGLGCSCTAFPRARSSRGRRPRSSPPASAAPSCSSCSSSSSCERPSPWWTFGSSRVASSARPTR